MLGFFGRWLFSLLALCLIMPEALLAQTNRRPNIVLLLVDDAGLMDFGSYGGEAKTRTIDMLAKNGVRFSNYHTSPLCATSRAMLLTGLDSHRTGIGTIPEALATDQHGHHSYALRLHDTIVTLADYLQAAGYATYMTGKWHLGRGPGDLPNSHGFDRSFVLDASGADNWEQKSYVPYYAEAPWFEDGAPAKLPDDFYSSRFLVDQMLQYLDSAPEEKPFFAFIGFQAIHIPVQAPASFTENYAGVYDKGWDALRQERFQKAQEIGLISSSAEPPQPPIKHRDWESLSPEDQRHYEKRMMVNAGMLEAMDTHIGRLIAHLKQTGQFDNTIFIVTSDNGPEYADPAALPSFRLWMTLNGYDDEISRLGEKGSMVSIGQEWASAAASPSSLFKMYGAEGSLRVPLIISGAGIENRGFQDGLSFVTDVMPTLLDLADLPIPEGLDGRSLRPILDGQATQVYGETDPVGIEVAGNSALFKGRYKLTRNTLPHGDAAWRLYDLVADPTEQIDLSADRPDLKEELLRDYALYAEDVGVRPLPASFDIQAQIAANMLKKTMARSMPFVLAALALLMALIGLFYYRRKSAR